MAVVYIKNAILHYPALFYTKILVFFIKKGSIISYLTEGAFKSPCEHLPKTNQKQKASCKEELVDCCCGGELESGVRPLLP